MLLEHSAILLTFVKLSFVMKTNFGLLFEWRLKTAFTVLKDFHVFSHNRLGMVHCIYQKITGLSFPIKMEFIHNFLILANSAVPDKMLHTTAFQLGLHCLQTYLFIGFP